MIQIGAYDTGTVLLKITVDKSGVARAALQGLIQKNITKRNGDKPQEGEAPADESLEKSLEKGLRKLFKK